MEGLSSIWVIRQPIRGGGLGLRSNVETSLAAFIGRLEQALPHFTGISGVCPQLAGLIGDLTGQAGQRWHQLLQSGCRTGRELSAAWAVLQLEAEQSSAYIGQDIGGHLAVQVEGVGGESVDGSTRWAVVQQREELRGLF